MKETEDEWRKLPLYQCQETGQPLLSVPLSVVLTRFGPSPHPTLFILPKMVIRDDATEINAK